MADHPMVELGVDEAGKPVHELPVYPQRHAYIENRVGRFASEIVDGLDIEGLDAAGVMAAAGSKAYELLCALIPNLSKRVPEYEWAGYGSKDAYKAREYDEAQDRSPSFPQIVHAFEVAVKVNRFDVFKALGGLIDPKLLRAEMSLVLSEVRERVSTGSLNSRGTNGESRPSGSGTTGPTSAASPHELASDAEAVQPPNGSGSLLTTSA